MQASDIFRGNLNALTRQLGISNVQLARALNVDPSLVSRWQKQGCGSRKQEQYAMAIGKYIAGRRLTPENASWLLSMLATSSAGDAITAARVALWLYPEANVPLDTDSTFPNMLIVRSFDDAVDRIGSASPSPSVASAGAALGANRIAALLSEALAQAKGTTVDLFLSSESLAAAVDGAIVDAFRTAVEQNDLRIRMLLQSANNTGMASRLVSTYLPLVVLGALELSVVQGTPQTFTATMNLIVPGRTAILVTEAAGGQSAPVAVTVQDPDVLKALENGFTDTLRYARPMMTVYDDSFARNIIETFFEEYGMPGSLDVIKSGINPMFLTPPQYGRVLEKYGHSPEQYAWRYDEFLRFKAAMDGVLQTSRFREIISLSCIREIARTGVCRLPSMYFANVGVVQLDAVDCVNILDGYLRYLETVPDLQVVLLDDAELFRPNSCWHIKCNKHIMLHSWNADQPVMAYSDQLLLIDEFQRHFDHTWNRIDTGSGSKRAAIEALQDLRRQTATHIQA